MWLEINSGASAWLLAAIVISANSCLSLLAIWVALGRGFWFWRVAALVGALLPLTFVPAFDLLFFSAAQAVLIIAVVGFAARFAGFRAEGINRRKVFLRTLTPRFALRDLGLIVLLLAVAFGLSRAMPANSFEPANEQMLWPILGTLIACAAGHAVLGPSRWWWRLAVMLVLLTAAMLIMPEFVRLANERQYASMGIGASGDGYIDYFHLPVIAVPWFVGTAIVIALTLARRSRPIDATAPVYRRATTATFVVFVGAISLPALIGFTALVWPIPIPDRGPIDTEGFAILEDASNRLELEWKNLDIYTATDAQLRPFVDRNAAQLAEIHRVIRGTGVHPISFEDGSRLSEVHVPRNILFALRIECRVAAMSGDKNLGLECCLALLRLANKTEWRAPHIHAIIASGVKSTAVKGLFPLGPSLDLAQLHRAIEEVAAFDRAAESFSRIEQVEFVYSCHAWGWRNRLMTLLEEFTDSSDNQSVLRVVFEGQAKVRLELIDLALRAFRTKHGQYPDKLDALVPEFLDAMPIDPFSAQPFVYRPEGDAYILYGVGPDQVDNGGIHSSGVPFDPNPADMFLADLGRGSATGVAPATTPPSPTDGTIDVNSSDPPTPADE